MADSPEATPEPAPAAAAPSRVVVGVDGSVANWSAVQWAAHEASRRDCPLVLVGAGSPGDQGTSDALEEVRRQLVGTGGTITSHAAAGDPSHALVRTTDQHDLLVVGRRSGHPVTRTVLGSTSVAVVGRSLGPVVVVPEGWSVHEHLDEAVVAGVEDRRDAQVLETAFARASELQAPLTVVSASAGPEARLEDLLDDRRRRYPAVTVRAVTHALAPEVALLGHAVGAQLLLLGRRTGPQHPGGLSIGSTLRPVLHHATCPVAVVPLGRSEDRGR